MEIALMNEIKVVPNLKAQKLSKSVLSSASLLAPVRTASKKVTKQQSISSYKDSYDDRSDAASFILNMTH
jgi:hypothetical protein